MRTVRAAAQASLLKSIQQSVASKQQSAVEVTQAYLQQLKSVEGQVQSFLTVNEEHALAQVSLQEVAAVGGLHVGCVLDVGTGIDAEGRATTAL
jgi:Asp-tRNA(Asn)/Glu-tRNA(Gln) amidotransferase A subunit family amidase